MKKLLPLILSTLLLTSCSGPDSSGGVEFSKTDNSFPYGDCRGPGYQTHSTENTGCGYFVNQIPNREVRYYIMPQRVLEGANLSGANLPDANLFKTYLFQANLSNANLSNAGLMNANLRRVHLAHANLSGAWLAGANLSPANLSNADLSDANLGKATLTGVKGNTSTICPNGKNYGTSGNNCGF